MGFGPGKTISFSRTMGNGKNWWIPGNTGNYQRKLEICFVVWYRYELMVIRDALHAFCFSVSEFLDRICFSSLYKIDIYFTQSYSGHLSISMFSKCSVSYCFANKWVSALCIWVLSAHWYIVQRSLKMMLLVRI